MIGMVRPAPRPAPSPCLPPSTCRGPQPVAPLQRQPTPGRVLHTLTLTLTLTLTRRPSAPRWPSPAPCRCSRALPRSRAPPSPCPSAPSKLLAPGLPKRLLTKTPRGKVHYAVRKVASLQVSVYITTGTGCAPCDTSAHTHSVTTAFRWLPRLQAAREQRRVVPRAAPPPQHRRLSNLRCALPPPTQPRSTAPRSSSQLTLRGAAFAAAARAGRPHICHARPPGPEQNRRGVAVLPRPAANRHHRLLSAPEARRLRQRRRPEVDEHAARAPRCRAPPSAARDRRDMARRL
eukprot:scaffold50263_cov51-Phaeocystis_antarctica.AAC.1